MRELLPSLQRVGVLENSTNLYYRAARSEFERSCQLLGIQPIFVGVAAGSELDNAVAEMARGRAPALFVNRQSLFVDNKVPLMSAAQKYALPTMAGKKDMLEAGVLLYYANSDAE